MQKFNSIQAFAELPEGNEATFLHPEGQAEQARLIKMRVNAPQPTNLYLEPVEVDYETGEISAVPDAEHRFLAHVGPGLENLEFYYKGSFSLSAIGGAVWLDTSDNTSFSVEASDFTNYARLWEREERDPRILEIEQAARHNQRVLMEQMAADREAFRREMEALAAKAKPDVTPSPAPADSGAASSVAPVSPVAPAGDPQPATPAPAGAGGEPDAGT